MAQPARLRYREGCYCDGPLSKNLLNAALRSLQIQLIPSINDNAGWGGSANDLDISESRPKRLK
jgi:hypothetical protein